MTIDGPEEHSALERKAKALFDSSVAGTDAAIRSRLNRARHLALAQRSRTAVASWRGRWLPGGVVAVAVIVALVLARLPDRNISLQATAASDLEILLDTEDLEFLQELEFYAWFDEQEDAEPGAGEGNGVG